MLETIVIIISIPFIVMFSMFGTFINDRTSFEFVAILPLIIPVVYALYLLTEVDYKISFKFTIVSTTTLMINYGFALLTLDARRANYYPGRLSQFDALWVVFTGTGLIVSLICVVAFVRMVGNRKNTNS